MSARSDYLGGLEPLGEEELSGYDSYLWLDEAAKRHPIVCDEHGTLRFRTDPVACWLHDRSGAYLNDLWLDVVRGLVSLDSAARHYRDIGYSLSGYHEVITAAYEELAAQIAPEPPSPSL